MNAPTCLPRAMAGSAVPPTLALLLFSALAPPVVLAEDAEAPTLALPTDRARTHPRIALVLDPAAAVFGDYGLRVGFAAGAHQAVWFFPSFQHRSGRRGAALEVAYAVMPLGKRLEGLRLAVFASAARFPGDVPVRHLRAGAEAGYAHLWGRLFLGGAAGAARRFVLPAPSENAAPWELVVRAEVGWVFL